MAVRRIITNRAKKSIRNLYWRSTQKSIQRKAETKSLVDAMVELVDTTPLSPSNESRGVLGIWKSKGYTIYESTHCFVRKTSGIRCKPMDSKQNLKRKWYFACVVDIRRNTVYIVNAVFAKYIDRLTDNTPTAIKFMNAMKGIYTRRSKQDTERRQLTIPFPENESKKYLLKKLVNECVDRCLRKYLNENLKTHDDEFNIYEKLEELDISYDFINDRENILEIRTPDKSTKTKVRQLLNYYGWKEIRIMDGRFVLKEYTVMNGIISMTMKQKKTMITLMVLVSIIT